MYRKEVNEHSPLRILEKSIHGGLGKGNLGVVMARAGVGKTACLVQIGLDELMRERPVLHVALEQAIDHVQSWYDALFEDLALHNDLENRDEVHATLTRNRMITAFADHDLWPERLEKMARMFRDHLHFRPAAIVVDGYPWEAHSVAENAAMIGALKSFAKLQEAELWMSAQTHRSFTGKRPSSIPPPCDAYVELIDVALFLEPHGDDVSVRLLKDHEHLEPVSDTHLRLHADAMRLVPDGGYRSMPRIPSGAYTLLSGGAAGAEAEFGICAERWGLAELNFSFAGRKPARTRGIVRLTADELAQGAVSPVYIQTHLHRKFPDTPFFQKTLQTIWHQVNTAGEVFVVGRVLPDGTVKGGTGWAAELGRHWSKPVHVFDQERQVWLHWADNAWTEPGTPVIRSRRFTGTGTRFLTDVGRQAIHDLFLRSFGQPPS